MVKKTFTVLGIDTSCDDTCLALLEVGGDYFQIKKNLVSSQIKIHQKYGGVYPTAAKREHLKNLPLLLKKLSFKPASLKKLAAIAVTVGPGLEPCLWTGINFAKELAKKWGKPLLPVNHLEAHLWSFLLPPLGQRASLFSKAGAPKKHYGWFFDLSKLMPALGLVVSGGHTQLILIKKMGDYKIVGGTRDDAAGECFDKTARILGLPYPGGPALAKIADRRTEAARKIKAAFHLVLPRPMIHTPESDFSFSGLKTAVLYDFMKRPEKVRKSKEYVKIMAQEIEQAVIDVLLKKTIKAAKDFQVKTIILGGGVAANRALRQQFLQKTKKELSGVKVFFPLPQFCTDNAAMIALTVWLREMVSVKKRAKKEAKKRKVSLIAQANLEI